jgi:hypothetical protein
MAKLRMRQSWLLIYRRLKRKLKKLKKILLASKATSFDKFRGSDRSNLGAKRCRFPNPSHRSPDGGGFLTPGTIELPS